MHPSRRTTSISPSRSATPWRSSTRRSCTCSRPTRWSGADGSNGSLPERTPASTRRPARCVCADCAQDTRAALSAKKSIFFTIFFAQLTFLLTFAPLKRLPPRIRDSGRGPFVYRLGRKIFILERAVRFCYGLHEGADERRTFRKKGWRGEIGRHPTGN